MKLKEIITNMCDLDPNADYDYSLSENKLNVNATKYQEHSDELEKLMKEIVDLKEANRKLLEKTNVESYASIEDIVADIVGLKKED